MAFNFEAAMHNALVDLGAIETVGLGDHYPLYFDTIGGFLLVHVNEDWVACRFDDIKAANANIHFGSLNPYSGKWNWHFEKVGQREVDFVAEQIRKILVPADQRRVRCPDCFAGQEQRFDDNLPDGYYRGVCRTCGGTSVDPSGAAVSPGHKAENGLLTVFARREPTKDPVLLSLGMSSKEDVVIYRDKECQQFFARWAWGSDGIPRKNTRRVTLNCYNWNLAWVDSPAATAKGAA